MVERSIRVCVGSNGRLDRSVWHLVVLEAEVVAELVDERVLDLLHRFAAVPRVAEDGAAEDDDLGRERGEHVEAHLRAHGAAENAEQLFVVRCIRQLVVLVGGLVLDGDDDVLETALELGGKLLDGLLDEPFELAKGKAGRAGHAKFS